MSLEDLEARCVDVAIARHAHEPNEEARHRLIRRTTLALLEEHGRVAIRLPALDEEETRCAEDVALYATAADIGWDAPLELFDAERGIRFERVALLMRVQKAPARVRAKWYARRFATRIRPTTQDELRVCREAAALVATENDPEERERLARWTELAAFEARAGIAGFAAE